MMDRYRAFYESLGERYPEDRIVYHTLSGQIRKKWILQKLQTLPKGNLLDCGCNIGTLSKNWRRGPVFGVDLSYAALNRGKTNAPLTAFIQADLRDLNMFRPASFDNAMACEVVEHLDKPEAFFEYLYEAMKKGGHVLVTAPNFTHQRPDLVELGVLRSYGVTSGTSGGNYLHTAYRPDELAMMAQAAGFAIVETGSFERELRGWLKPLTLIEETFNALSKKIFPTSKLVQLLERFMSLIEIDAFGILDTVFLSQMLRRIFKQGRRSYIVAER
jgi:2-polyprenyl-3-methyl-5-hydroxy-6-metoxy-1,4-benzoquinol methylase